jgi:hypothetical protein
MFGVVKGRAANQTITKSEPPTRSNFTLHRTTGFLQTWNFAG